MGSTRGLSCMYYVVGSGPAGIACAHALTSAGRTVTILAYSLDAEFGARDRRQ